MKRKIKIHCISCSEVIGSMEESKNNHYLCPFCGANFELENDNINGKFSKLTIHKFGSVKHIYH